MIKKISNQNRCSQTISIQLIWDIRPKKILKVCFNNDKNKYSNQNRQNVLTMIKKTTFNQICFRSVHRHYRQTAIFISHFTYMKTSIPYGLGLNYV